MAKASVNIEQKRCKGCALCVFFCPKKILRSSQEINSFGYHPAEADDPKKCTGCGICALVCPDAAITVQKEETA